jgi:hypothetical protein
MVHKLVALKHGCQAAEANDGMTVKLPNENRFAVEENCKAV